VNKYQIYRPEIDGLRAISVLAVIFYHAEITLFEKPFFSGGFIGVDIFFVISGYLITKIILNELKNTKNFSFLNFYKRRARRILPILFFVMLVSFPFVFSFVIPNFFVDYSKSIISSLFLYQIYTFGTLVLVTINCNLYNFNLFFIPGHFQWRNSFTLYFQLA